MKKYIRVPNWVYFLALVLVIGAIYLAGGYGIAAPSPSSEILAGGYQPPYNVMMPLDLSGANWSVFNSMVFAKDPMPRYAAVIMRQYHMVEILPTNLTASQTRFLLSNNPPRSIL